MTEVGRKIQSRLCKNVHCLFKYYFYRDRRCCPGPSLDFEKGNLTLVFYGLPQEFCSILIVKKATIEKMWMQYVSFHMNKLCMGAKLSLAKVKGQG